MPFEVEASHLYKGCVGRMTPGTDPCVMRFGDGSVAAAEWDADTARLALQPYTTAAGTRIAARCWQVRLLPGGRFKVLSRVT